MPRRVWRRVLLVFAIVCALAVAGVTPQATTGQGLGFAPARAAAADAPLCPGQSAKTSNPTGLVKGAHPVVLVHGWTGTAMQDTRTMLEKNMGSGWQFELFDYHDHSGDWAASPQIAKPLAAYIHCVAQAHRAAGGDGHVFVVAHSMGGLATMYAAAQSTGGIANLGSDLGGVVTLDTPWAGSSWGQQVVARALQFASLVGLPSAGSDAWSCLRKVGPHGTGGCTTPSYFPPVVPVRQVAGDVTIARTIFGVHAYDMPMSGDLIVSTDSQQSYVTSAPGTPFGESTNFTSVSCTKDLSTIEAETIARFGASSGWLGAVLGGLTGADVQMLMDGRALDALAKDQADPSLVELVARAVLVTECSHVGMPTNPSAISAIAAQLRSAAAAVRFNPISIRNAPIPACGGSQSPSRLTNGQVNFARNMGGASLLGNPVSVDLNGDGTKDVVTRLECSAGGVSWPEYLLAYQEGPTLLASMNLGDVPQARQHEHADISAFTASGDGVRVSWRTYDGCCFGTKKWTGVLKLQSGKLVMTDVTQTFGPTGNEGDPASWVVAPGQIGPFHAGISAGDAEAYGWAQLNPSGQCEPEIPSQTLEGKVGFSSDADQKIALLVPEAGQSTAQGIHVGSPVALLKATYGSALAETPTEYSGTAWLLRGRGAKYIFFQSSDGVTVQNIQVGAAAAPQFLEEGC